MNAHAIDAQIRRKKHKYDAFLNELKLTYFSRLREMHEHRQYNSAVAIQMIYDFGVDRFRLKVIYLIVIFWYHWVWPIDVIIAVKYVEANTQRALQYNDVTNISMASWSLATNFSSLQSSEPNFGPNNREKSFTISNLCKVICVRVRLWKTTKKNVAHQNEFPNNNIEILHNIDVSRRLK